MTRKRGRKPDTKIIYTPQQTERYKSQWNRYEKGLELARSFNTVHKIDDKTYRVTSARSPIGYWEVKVGNDIEGESLWNFDYDYTQGSSSNSEFLSTTIEEETTRFSSSLTRNSLLLSGASPGNYLFVMRRYGTIGFDLSANSVTYIYNWNVSHSIPIYQAYSESGGGSYSPDTQIEVYSSNVEYDDDKYVYEAYASDVVLSGSSGSITTLLPPDIDGTKFLQFGVEFEVRGDNVGGGQITIDQSFQILEINSEAVEIGGYQCTCPDFSLKEAAFDPPAFPSKSQPRNWQGTDAGCPTWADGKKRCCHIVAVQDIRDEDIPVPQDIPLL